jgi:hypothetical protein
MSKVAEERSQVVYWYILTSSIIGTRLISFPFISCGKNVLFRQLVAKNKQDDNVTVLIIFKEVTLDVSRVN